MNKMSYHVGVLYSFKQCKRWALPKSIQVFVELVSIFCQSLATVSDKNLGQGLPFSPFPLFKVVLLV